MTASLHGCPAPYDVIYADPPWWYPQLDKKHGHPQYPMMKPQELRDLSPLLDEFSSDVCALIMWYTGPHAEEAMDLGRAWGFTYVTKLLSWCKTGVHHPDQLRLIEPDDVDDFNVYSGGGRYTAHGTEDCGLWRRGSLPKVADLTIRQVIHAPVRGHSRKPDEARKRIERLWPNAKRLEMFARDTCPGWSSWGNQVGKFGEQQRGTA